MLSFNGDIGYYGVFIGKSAILKVYMGTLKILPFIYAYLELQVLQKIIELKSISWTLDKTAGIIFLPISPFVIHLRTCLTFV